MAKGNGTGKRGDDHDSSIINVPPSPLSPADPDLAKFLDDRFDEHDWPEAVVLHEAIRQGRRFYPGPQIRTYEWKPSGASPKPTKPGKAELVVIVAEIVSAARQHAAAKKEVGVRLASYLYMVYVRNPRKDSAKAPYASHSLVVRRTDLEFSGEAPLGGGDAISLMDDDETEEDGEGGNSLVVAARMAQKHERKMFKLTHNALAMSQFQLAQLTQQLGGMVVELNERLHKKDIALEEARNNQAARDAALNWQNLQMGLISEGVGIVKQLGPALVNGVAQRDIIPGSKTAVQVAIDNFLESLDESTQYPRIFGRTGQGKEADPEALLSLAQASAIFELQEGSKREQTLLQKLKREFSNPEFMARASVIFQPKQVSGLLAILQYLPAPAAEPALPDPSKG